MSAIRQMTYLPVGGVATTVEVMTFDRLRELNDRGTQRGDFHVLALIDGGHGAVTVDFHRHRIDPRSVVWIAPGAVHRWDDIANVAGQVVLFVPTAPVTPATRQLVASPDVAARWTASVADWRFIDVARNHLLLEASAPPYDASAELPAIVLSALISRLRPPRTEAPSPDPVFLAFRVNVEAHFREHHDAGFYAQSMGYAPRTLSRAVKRATGRTAKAFIVDRIVLEAKRMLAHEGWTAARCARTLGFPDASNFSVFFRSATGLRPGAWQATVGMPWTRAPH